jgi:general secretion pathway protein G
MKRHSKLYSTIIFFSLLFAVGCTIERGARKEDLLKEDLYQMRTAIDQYTQDKNKPPQHLTDLVSAGYLQAIPKDPITNSASTWVEEPEGAADSVDRRHPGLLDVHSGSTQISSDGTRYDSW